MTLRHLCIFELQCQTPCPGQCPLTLHTRAITSLQFKFCAHHTHTVVSTSPCSWLWASFHPLLLLCRLFPHFLPCQAHGFAVLYTPSVSLPIMSAVLCSQVFLILLTDAQNFHWKAGTAPLCCYSITSKQEAFPRWAKHPISLSPPSFLQLWTVLLHVLSQVLCLSQGTTLHSKQWPGCSEKEKHLHPLRWLHLPSQHTHPAPQDTLPCKRAWKIRLFSFRGCLFCFPDTQAEPRTCCSLWLSNALCSTVSHLKYISGPPQQKQYRSSNRTYLKTTAPVTSAEAIAKAKACQ